MNTTHQQTIHRTTGRAWWQHGAATETPQQAAAKRMTTQQIRHRIHTLTDTGLLT